METNSHDDEILDDRQYQAAVAESKLNGRAINWRYWVHQLPTQTGAEAALLMSGLDPDLFKSLESRSNRNDQSLCCKKAAMIQRLAEREGKGTKTPSEWLSWARAHQIVVHDGYVLEVESASERASGAETKSPMVVEIGLDAHAAQQPQAEAPAVGVSGGDAAPLPDPVRRLARLRELGGSATYRRNEWKFTGIAALVATEKNEDRKRSDEKTIRADLREAAEAERDAKRAGPWGGLGG